MTFERQLVDIYLRGVGEKYLSDRFWPTHRTKMRKNSIQRHNDFFDMKKFTEKLFS